MIRTVLFVALAAGAAHADRATDLARAAEIAWPRELVRHRANTAGGASAHVAAALAAETPEVSAELLLAIAYVESRFQPDSTSRNVAGGKRAATRWPSSHPGRGFRPNYFCGPVQAKARTWKRCLELRDLATGYAAGAAELAAWYKRAARHRDDDRLIVDAALGGHGCGNAGLRTGCRRYAARVRAQERKIMRALTQIELARAEANTDVDDGNHGTQGTAN